MERPRIVILGGGFAGIATAARLEHVLREDEAEIALVSRENFSLFTPMIPEVSSGGLASRHIVTPIRAQLRRTRFYLGDVLSIDLAARRVEIAHALLETEATLRFDHLVLALGSVTSTFGLPGVAEHSLPLRTLDDAERLRNHVIAMLEIADVTTDPQMRAQLLTFVLVGGGFTGVEAAGEMVDFFWSIARFYRSVERNELRVILVEGGPRLLPDLAPKMGEYSARALRKRGIEIVLGELVSEVDDACLSLKSGRRIPTKTVVWSAGVRPSPLVQSLGLPKGRGGAIATDPDMSVPGHPGIWVIGDCAAIPDGSGGTYPPTAQHAIREGPVLADNIMHRLRGEPTRPFTYKGMGMMASLGARRGVAGLGGFILSGFPAFVLWRTYYLLRLPGLDRRLRVAFDWTLNLIFPRDIAELRVFALAARPDLHMSASAAQKVKGAASQP